MGPPRVCRGGWKLDPSFDGSTIHARPRDDLIWHPLDEECPCGPTSVELVDESGGHVVWGVLHHALDGRDVEHVDQAHEGAAGG